jgi:hypothetical protein
MIRLFSISVLALILVNFGSASHGQDDGSEKRLHFTLVSENETANLLPVDAAAPIAAGETRVSCRAVEFSFKYNKPRTVLVECRIESVDSWLEGERVNIEYSPDGLRFSGTGLKNHFRTPEAEAKHKENLRRVNAKQMRDSIDRGMIESEKEHRKHVLEQLRRSFITGQGQITKR